MNPESAPEITATEAPKRRAIFFYDSQNLYAAVRRMWGYRYANFDPVALSNRLADAKGWAVQEIRVYTGVHRQSENPRLHAYWTGKLSKLKRQGCFTFHRELSYHDRTDLDCPNCGPGTTLTCAKCGHTPDLRDSREKGVDVKIALDLVSLAHSNAYDVAVLMSQDQDYAPAALRVNEIAREQSRLISVLCAFPDGHDDNKRIDNTRALPFTASDYDDCLDMNSYGTTIDPKSK